MCKGKLALAALLFISAPKAAPLDVRFICHDILIHPGVMKIFSIQDQLRVSSQGQSSSPNDELAWAPPNIPTTHWGTFFYTDGQTFESFTLPFIVNIPSSDANENGIHDLLEYSQSVANLQTVGSYTDPFGDEGVFAARWTKAANSHSGSLRITFDFTNPNGFDHTFEILEYAAPFDFATTQGSTINGPITLIRAGNPEHKLAGNLALHVDNGVVHLDTTSLTNEVDLQFTWDQAPALRRDGNEFWEFINVQDGWLYEPTPDFHDWMVVIKDTNDSDGDGTPDIIDAAPVAATAARLEIVKTAQGIQILIYGDIGRAYTLEEVTTLPATQWNNPTAVTLATSPHLVDLPAPSTPTFWRARFP